jgi:hypothetical protein
MGTEKWPTLQGRAGGLTPRSHLSFWINLREASFLRHGDRRLPPFGRDAARSELLQPQMRKRVAIVGSGPTALLGILQFLPVHASKGHQSSA